MPSVRRFARELAASLLRLTAYLGALAAFAVAVAYFLPQFMPLSAGVAAVSPQAQSDWVDVARPYPAFALVMSEFDGTESHYTIRRHPLGGRKDIISFGNPSGSTHLEVEIYRLGGEQDRFADAATEIAARVADLGAGGGMKAAGAIDTKFGRLSLLDFTVDPVSGLRRCLGFARGFAEPPLQIAGFYCRAGPEIVDRSVLACALDRLTLAAAGTEPKLAELFARAELERNFCGHHGPVLAATRKRSTWIDKPRDPKLRGRLAAQ